ncbi:hypothetical protein TI39_contig352g00006 [Zymoseptoria brevis]|uniref:Uncharacterized protein n=1 Tax=Zymoseptoria brevis TaxID=1047168 RepID=A0A0F4GQN8_9PEZI|nr:hypothetical protein TI39_contig352g00006 [Zymoseptoria brevis]
MRSDNGTLLCSPRKTAQMSDHGLAPPPYSAASARRIVESAPSEERAFDEMFADPEPAELLRAGKNLTLGAQTAGPFSRSSNAAPILKVPLTTPGIRFQLWIRSPVLKGIKVVALTDLMTVEEVFAALQKSLGRPFEGKEILSFFVSIPDEEGPFRINKGDSDASGWEAVLCVVKEGNLTKLTGVVEAEDRSR